MLNEYKIISINGSHGFDAQPPFSEHLRLSPNLLCLNFDDIADESEVGSTDGIGFTDAVNSKFKCEWTETFER